MAIKIKNPMAGEAPSVRMGRPEAHYNEVRRVPSAVQHANEFANKIGRRKVMQANALRPQKPKLK